MNNRDFYKDIMSNVQPSEKSVERIFDMSKKKTKERMKLAPVLAFAACLTILVTAVFGGSAITARLNPVVTDGNTTLAPGSKHAQNVTHSVNNFFTLTAYAEKSDETQAITKSSKYTLQDSKIKAYYDNDGYYTVHMKGKSGFEVNGENIKTVRYQCKSGNFGHCIDFSKMEYLKRQNKYYDAIIPYSNDLKNLSGSALTSEVFKNYENGEYDEYFESKKPVSEFLKAELVYDENENIIGVGFVSLEIYHSISSKKDTQDFTFTNFMNYKKDFNSIYWEPNTSVLFTEDGKSRGVKIEELEHDTLTVTVTYNDGSSECQSYDLGFNANGNLEIQKL